MHGPSPPLDHLARLGLEELRTRLDRLLAALSDRNTPRAVAETRALIQAVDGLRHLTDAAPLAQMRPSTLFQAPARPL